MKQFNNTTILTTKNPEAFLNFTYDSSNLWIYPSCTNVYAKTLYVNGLDITSYSASLGYVLRLNSTDTIASFHIFTSLNSSFDVNVTFNVFDTSDFNSDPSPIQTYDVSILNRPYVISSNNGAINQYTNDDILIEDEASYMLLRTNPKFTGNVKLYVDSSNYMYLDTFKVSDILSNKKYRHQKVSAASILSSDIRNVFSTLPLGELYRVDVDDTLNVSIPETQLKDQYRTAYNYGATLIKDELYPEDNGILAPLWINSKLPDYFAVFRLNGVYNQETYRGSSLLNLATKYLEESDIIKSWSMQYNSPLGIYLSTHMADVIKIQSPVFLSLTDPSLNESDPNTWYGIAVDKGVLTGRSETTYYFDKKSSNFTDLNAFVSQGFERNTLLCPNIVNLEFIFSDNDVSMYTMSRYFGLYLTENILYKIAYYADSSSGNVEIISLDGKDSSVFINSSLFDVITGDILPQYANRILVLNDGKELHRFKNVNDLDTLAREHLSKPKNNIYSVETEKTNINPFITLTLNRELEQGEHLRIVNKTQNTIWEAYGVDASQYPCDKYCTQTLDVSDHHAVVYRTFFNTNGTIAQQIREIEQAFDRFEDYEVAQFRSGLRGDNWVSIILNDNASTSEDWQFQRLTASTRSTFYDVSTDFNDAGKPDDITFFGVFTPTENDFGVVTYDSSYGPIDFELYGDRQSISLNLFNRATNNLYSFDSSKNILDKFEQTTLVQGPGNWYEKLLTFDISTRSYLYVKDPLHIHDKVLVMTTNEISLIQNQVQLNAYDIWPLNISLMGINPVKDIDYTVYDPSIDFKSEYFYNREDDASTYSISIDACSGYTLDIQGSYVVKYGAGQLIQNGLTRTYGDPSSAFLFNTFDSSVYILANTTTNVTYAILDGSHNYTGYNPNVAEESMASYYDSSAFLKYGLTVPLVSKWVGTGTDVRGNLLRLTLDPSLPSLIADSTHYTQEISYPVFKYLTPGNKAWESYVFYDINDVIYDASTYRFLTLKEAMITYPYVDYFSKLVYSNNNVDATKTRSSIVYYNGYKNTIDTIFTGLNISMKVQEVAKNVIDIKNYNRYRFSFISTASKNRDSRRPIEVIINENTKTILVVWYQGNDELNYNMRYSTFLPGKSLLDPSNYGFVTGTQIDSSYYSFVKTPFYFNNSVSTLPTVSMYDATTTMYASDIANTYAQFNKNLYGLNSVWNTYHNLMTNRVFYAYRDKQYNTFVQYLNYTYFPSNNTYNTYTTNYGYKYNSNQNLYVNNTTNLNTFQDLLRYSNTNVMYYIIRGTQLITSYNTELFNPISLSINPPRTYRQTQTYNGWFKPKFNSILEFNSDEDSEFINVVQRGFMFSNTNLRMYNNIPQLWYNKVVSTVTQQDVSAGDAISFVSNFNTFNSLWDKSYYIKDGNLIDGFQNPDELSSFFGSKLPKLPDSIALENWDTTTATSSETETEITLFFNLTRAILNKFNSNLTFINNWAGLSYDDNVINSYIKNTIITYYNISHPKILVDFYYKSFSVQRLYYRYNSTFIINDNKQNFNGQLVYENDEYIYKIIIPKSGNFSYFVKFTMTEK
jgi:hypothetical protein